MNNLTPHQCSPRRAFTLIELLTVIAIIGILAAIIIPTVGKVRNTAKAAQCVSNLRQIGFAVNLYAQANKDRLPGPVFDGQRPRYYAANGLSGSPGSLTALIEPYTQQKSKNGGLYANTLLDCPAWRTETLDPSSDTSMFMNTAPKGWSTTNATIRPFGEITLGGDTVSQPMTVTQIGRYPLSTTWMMMDIDQLWFQDTGKPGWYQQIPKNPVHGSNRRNVLYFDCHVSAGPGGTRPANW